MSIQPVPDAVPIWIQPHDMLIEWDLSSTKLAQERLIAGLVGEAGNVVDLGCGNGRYSKVLNYQSYTGYDSSFVMIADAKRRNPDKQFALIDIFKFQSDESYDTLLLIDVAIHMIDPVPAVKAILNNWTAQRYFVTLLVGEEHQQLLNSTVINHAEFWELFEIGLNVNVLHEKRVETENFDWRVVRLERI